MPIFNAELWLPEPLEKVFPFFADAHNLKILSPPWLNFEIQTPSPIVMRVGTLIDYRIGFRGIPLRWRTQILEWNPPFQFVDDQIRGPYRKWTHTHTFSPKDGGTLCRDHVDYSVWGGWIPDRLVVRRDVAKIFAFRQEALQKHFAGPKI